MCGRFLLTTPGEALVELLGLADTPHLSARYNIAPMQQVLVAVPTRGEAARALRPMRWGLLPHWSKEPVTRAPMFNARGETVAEKPAFRASFRRRRCLIPADGFYEWKREGKNKQPYLIRMCQDGPFAFAGLWDHWERPGRPPIESCTIVTTSPNKLVGALHDRMPVILFRDDYSAWLDTDATPAAEATQLLRPYPDAEMEAFPVSRAVNNVANDSPECVTPEPPHNNSLLV